VVPLVKYHNSSLIHLLEDLEEDRRLEWEWDHSRVGVDSVFLPNKHRWAELLDRWVEPLEEVALEWEHRQLSSLEDFNNSPSSSRGEDLVHLVDLSNNNSKWLLPLNRCSGGVNSQRGRG
jgi:hypothetical protein